MGQYVKPNTVLVAHRDALQQHTIYRHVITVHGDEVAYSHLDIHFQFELSVHEEFLHPLLWLRLIRLRLHILSPPKSIILKVGPMITINNLQIITMQSWS